MWLEKLMFFSYQRYQTTYGADNAIKSISDRKDKQNFTRSEKYVRTSKCDAYKNSLSMVYAIGFNKGGINFEYVSLCYILV